MNESAMESVKTMLLKNREKSRKRQIDFLRTYYNKDIVDNAVEYTNFEIERMSSYPNSSIMLDMAKTKALEAGQKDVADFIEMQMEFGEQDPFNIITSAYARGMSDGLSNPNISQSSEPVSSYVLTKDFSFIFDFADNVFKPYIERAARKFCNAYNNLLNKIEISSSDSDGNGYIMLDTYKKDIEFMENPDNVRELMKAAFVGEYITSSIDRCCLVKTTKFNAMEHINMAQEFANNYFNFKTNTYRNYWHNTEQVDWKFGTWDEVSKFGLEKYKSLQSQKDLERANGDFTKYWLNNEVLIVRMVNGKLVAEIH